MKSEKTQRRKSRTTQERLAYDLAPILEAEKKLEALVNRIQPSDRVIAQWKKEREIAQGLLVRQGSSNVSTLADGSPGREPNGTTVKATLKEMISLIIQHVERLKGVDLTSEKNHPEKIPAQIDTLAKALRALEELESKIDQREHLLEPVVLSLSDGDETDHVPTRIEETKKEKSES